MKVLSATDLVLTGSVIFIKGPTSCWIDHFSESFLRVSITGHFLFLIVLTGCEDATQGAIKAWSAALSCRVVSLALFVLINCWEKCVTSCQADCWCPPGHPSVPGAHRCYCGSRGRRAEESRAGPCRMRDNTGKEEEGIPELCAEARSAECLSEQPPENSPPSSPEDRLCHPLTFAREGSENRYLCIVWLHNSYFRHKSSVIFVCLLNWRDQFS